MFTDEGSIEVDTTMRRIDLEGIKENIMEQLNSLKDVNVQTELTQQVTSPDGSRKTLILAEELECRTVDRQQERPKRMINCYISIDNTQESSPEF